MYALVTITQKSIRKDEYADKDNHIEVALGTNRKDKYADNDHIGVTWGKHRRENTADNEWVHHHHPGAFVARGLVLYFHAVGVEKDFQLHRPAPQRPAVSPSVVLPPGIHRPSRDGMVHACSMLCKNALLGTRK